MAGLQRGLYAQLRLQPRLASRLRRSAEGGGRRGHVPLLLPAAHEQLRLVGRTAGEGKRLRAPPGVVRAPLAEPPRRHHVQPEPQLPRLLGRSEPPAPGRRARIRPRGLQHGYDTAGLRTRADTEAVRHGSPGLQSRRPRQEGRHRELLPELGPHAGALRVVCALGQGRSEGPLPGRVRGALVLQLLFHQGLLDRVARAAAPPVLLHGMGGPRPR